MSVIDTEAIRCGESLFLLKIFPGSCSKNQQKITRPLMPAAAPIRPRHLVSTQQGVETQIPNDLTVFRDVLQVDSVSLRQPARHYTYRGLKIFTSLVLRFHDFQRRCDYIETDSVRKTLTKKKVFEKISDRYCTEPFATSSSNIDLAKIMRSAVEHCENRLKKKNRVLDKELFENTVDFIDWKSLLK